VRTLENNGIYSCGTIKVSSAGLPEQVKSPPRLARGESLALQHENLVATVWQDKKQVCMLKKCEFPIFEFYRYYH
jgi:hypothetical protein